MHDAAMAVAFQPVDLLERERELAVLERALADVEERSAGRVVLVSGEAGAGKTTLLRAFCRDRERVLWGGCEPLFTPRPLGPLLDIADAVGSELDGLLLRDPTPHDAFVDLTRALRAERAVVVLEDVHWADEATLDVLKLLGRRIDAVPALVVVTYRDDELDARHPLRLVIGDLPVPPAAQRLRLAALSRETVGALGDAHGLDGDELWRKTGGNPFFVTEALAAGGDVPPTVRDAVLARAARVGAEARELLDAAAVVPQRAAPWLLASIAGDFGEALDECVTTGILVVSPLGVAFRHELARLVIEEAIPPARRATLHRRALDALSDPPSGGRDFARLAHHAEAAGDSDAVRRYAIAAAHRAETLRAHREAAAQYARALRFGDDLPPGVRADLLAAQARACFPADMYEEGIAALEREVELRRGLGDAVAEGDAERRLAQFLWCPGRVDESRRAAERAVALLEQVPPTPELGWAYVELAFTHAYGSRVAEAIECRQRAIALAEEVGVAAIAVEARLNAAVATKDIDEIVTQIEAATAQSQPGLMGHLWMTLANVAVSRRRFDIAADAIDRGLAVCSDNGFELTRLYLLAYRAILELDEGRWDEAAETASMVLRIRRTSTTPRIRALVALALVRLRRGDPDVDSLLEEAWALAEPTGELQRMQPVLDARSELDWLEGRRDPEGLFPNPYGPYETAVVGGDVAALDALGATRAADAARCAAGLRGPRPATRANPAGLTSREVEVLTLVARDLSNKQIAAELVVSKRTVDHHVAAILRKLRVRTRGEATAQAVRVGALDDPSG
jgi:DNA-binding CsgD family transcriptional regulator/tetratricopeptide (TPR) repeat protein